MHKTCPVYRYLSVTKTVFFPSLTAIVQDAYTCTLYSIQEYNFYAAKTYIMHFLEAAQFLNDQVLARRKVNVLYAPGLTVRLPPTTAVWALKQPLCSHLHKITNEPVDYMVLAPYVLLRGKDITWAIRRVGP